VARVQRRFGSQHAISKPLGRGDRRCCCSLHRHVPQPRRTKRFWRHLQLMRGDAPKGLCSSRAILASATYRPGATGYASPRWSTSQCICYQSVLRSHRRLSRAPRTLRSVPSDSVSSPWRFRQAAPYCRPVRSTPPIRRGQRPLGVTTPSVHTRDFMGRSIHCLAPSRSSVIPALNVILARWWRPLSGADSGGGG
jgi:hypothetical protein